MYIDDLKKLIKEIEKAVQSNEKWITFEDHNLKNKLTRISEDASHSIKNRLKQTDKHIVNPYYYPNLNNQSNITQPLEQSTASHSPSSNNSPESIVSTPISQTSNSTIPPYSSNSNVVGNIKNFINEKK